jgi:2-methylcitrate dehydratase PrpD
MLNGIAGRAVELCEGMRFVSAQPAVQVLPGVLAIGEHMNRSGREFLAAFVAGYEVAARLCMAFTPRPLAHPNGQATLLGAVAAGARVRGLDAAGISLAMRIATVLIMTPGYTSAVAGATALNVAGGMSGFAAVLAPTLAVSGFEARKDAVEESLSLLVGEGFRVEGLTDQLGRRWGITENYFRLYACCNPVHAALDALQAVLAMLGPRPEEIDRIDIATYRFASVMCNPDPANHFASKYSLPHAAATMIVRGDAGFSELDDGSLLDPAIASLRRLVHIVEDPEMSAVVPRSKPARVTVLLKDGRRATQECATPRGGVDRPFEESEVRAKFRELAGLVLSPPSVSEVEALIDRAEEWDSVQELAAMLRGSGKA